MPIVSALLASAAGIAWFNAKTQLTHDLRLLYPYWARYRSVRALETRDRVNFFYVLEEHATTKALANAPFVVYEGKTWTYKEVYDTVLQYGTWLKQEYGIVPKEIIAMDFMNRPQLIFLWLAIWSLGAYPAFINYNLTGEPLLHSVKASNSRILFADEEVRPRIMQVLDALTNPGDGNPVHIVFFNEATEKDIARIKAAREPDLSRAGVKGPEVANLIYTSGTTGLPKPAVVSWNKAYIGGGIAGGCMSMAPSDRFYTVSFLQRNFPAYVSLAVKALSPDQIYFDISVCPFTTHQPPPLAFVVAFSLAAPFFLVTSLAPGLSGRKYVLTTQLLFNMWEKHAAICSPLRHNSTP